MLQFVFMGCNRTLLFYICMCLVLSGKRLQYFSSHGFWCFVIVKWKLFASVFSCTSCSASGWQFTFTYIPLLSPTDQDCCFVYKSSRAFFHKDGDLGETGAISTVRKIPPPFRTTINFELYARQR